MTQRERYMVENYFNSNKTELSQCYRKYSPNKRQAYGYCRHLMSEDNGFRFRIISHNSFNFICAYLFIKNYSDMYLKYFTSSRTYLIKLDEETRHEYRHQITGGY